MANAINLDDLISQAEAAEIRGVSRASINELVKRGRLRTAEIGGKIFLYRSEVESFEPQPGGRPPTAKPAAAQPAKRRGRKAA
jgi:excisionase family DNA binding protein